MPSISLFTMPSASITSFLRAFFVFKLLSVGFLLAPLVSAVPHPISPLFTTSNKAANASSSPPLHAVTFTVPCPGCLDGPADAALPFELVHDSTTGHCENVSLTLNGQPFVLGFQDDVVQTVVRVSTADRTVDLSVQGYCDQPRSQPDAICRQVLFFDVDLLDGSPQDTSPSFTVVLNASVQAEALVIPHPHPDTQCLSLKNEVDITSALFSADEDQAPESEDYDSQATHAADEPAAIQEPPSKELRKRFNEERELIRRLTMDCKSKLLDDIRSCNHDVKCSGKAICHHLRDAVMNLVATLKSSLKQTPLVSDERQWQAVVADDYKPNYGAISSSDNSKNSDSASDASLDNKSIIILALEILAGVLGLAGLFSCIRHHCHSFRRRTERLADREERKRAREYRRLARKEAFRKKWVAFKGVFTRFPCRSLSCEEKQALVLEAAAFATGEDVTVEDVEHAYMSFSREYLASLAGQSTTSLRHKQNDTRSRSDSLPSYGSEKLPDYSSQPDNDVIVDGYRAYSPSLTGCSTNTAVTPDSSVPDLSPRCSRETLRTLMSRD